MFRYLGNKQELVALANQRKGMTTTTARRILSENPQMLEGMGLTAATFTASYSIDHIVPRSKGGVNHPLNYCVMKKTVNNKFGNRVSLAKLELVGFYSAWFAVAICLQKNNMLQ